MLLHALGGFVLGMLIFGMGFNAAQQMRVAAADMFPPRLRAVALGFVATGSSIGLLITPVLMWISEPIARAAQLEPLALPWLMLPALILAGMVLVTFVRPDPKQIGMNLKQYYPDYTGAPEVLAQPQSAFSVRALWRNPRSRSALISNCAGYGNMSIVMVLTSLVLAHHGHSLTAITFSHMFHSAGMFAFGIPLGWLADRFGRESVMYSGVTTTLVGALSVTFGAEFWSVTVGTFLVGIGWAAANVSSTALVADVSKPEHRGRAIGVLDSGAALVTVLAAALTGPLVQHAGLPAAGVAAAMVAAVPLSLLVLPRPRAPGQVKEPQRSGIS